MKLYAATAATAAGGLLVVGLDSTVARIVAVAILVTSCLALGMLLEANPTREDDPA